MAAQEFPEPGTPAFAGSTGLTEHRGHVGAAQELKPHVDVTADAGR